VVILPKKRLEIKIFPYRLIFLLEKNNYFRNFKKNLIEKFVSFKRNFIQEIESLVINVLIDDFNSNLNFLLVLFQEICISLVFVFLSLLLR